MQCPQCTHGKLVQISLRIADKDVVMRSCSVCETRWWVGDGERIGLGGVLELAGATRR